MNILIISPYLPYPPDDGVRIRLFNLIKRISRKHNVALLSFIDSVDQTRHVPFLSKYCCLVETVVTHRHARWSKFSSLIYALYSGVPLESRLAFDKEMADKMHTLLEALHFDIVHVDGIFMAGYLKEIPQASNIKKVVTVIDILSIKFRRMFKIEKKLFTRIRLLIDWLIMRKWEVRVLSEIDKGITVSSLDKQSLQRVDPRLDISVIDNGVDVEQYNPLLPNREKKNILFLGIMGYQPNHDAALFFCTKILPLVKKKIANCKFFIVGKGPKQPILDLSDDEHVIVTGYVDDIRSFYQSSDISVVPLRAGGGSRLKILEAMALGRPVVSTSIGCEGLEVIAGQHLLVADDPEDFAKKTVQLLTDEALYDHLVREARKLVETQYSWDSVAENLVNVYSALEHSSDNNVYGKSY